MNVLKHKVNGYNTVEVTDPCLALSSQPQKASGDLRAAPITPPQFEERLWTSLQKWKKDNRNGVFLEIPLDLADLVPVAVRAGFTYHHCEATYLVLTAWFKDETLNKLPPGPVHFIGVAGFVVREVEGIQQVLVIRERSGPTAKIKDFWKLPGGLVDQHEDIREAVIREVREETGIDTSFGRLSSIQESHHLSPQISGFARKGTTDLYCICTLTPKDPDQPITPQVEEVTDCIWMDVDDFLTLPFYAQQDTVFHQAFHAAANVASGKSSGLEVSSYKLGFTRSEVMNSLFTASPSEASKL